MKVEQGETTQRTLLGSVLRNVSESAIYGVVLVAGLVVILSDGADASWRVLVKVLATLLVFWLAHVYAAVVAHLGDEIEAALPTRQHLLTASRRAIADSWGMLVAAIIPVAILALGVSRLLNDSHAIWGTLWAAVLVLGVLGWLGVATWTTRASTRIAAALLTSLLGVALISLKVLVH